MSVLMNSKSHRYLLSSALCAAICLPDMSFGALIDRGGGLIYDTDLDITWLANANYGIGSSYDITDDPNNGLMTWHNAMAWVENLVYYDTIRDVNYADWRLPATLQPDPSCSEQIPIGTNISTGLNCSGSELGHLFYSELGGAAGQAIVTTHNSNYSLFSDIMGSRYWSSTDASQADCCAWDFNLYNGQQDYSPKDFFGYAWAVRDGDVASVPIPATAWLLGSGLLGIAYSSRRRQPR